MLALRIRAPRTKRACTGLAGVKSTHKDTIIPTKAKGSLFGHPWRDVVGLRTADVWVACAPEVTSLSFLWCINQGFWVKDCAAWLAGLVHIVLDQCLGFDRVNERRRVGACRYDVA